MKMEMEVKFTGKNEREMFCNIGIENRANDIPMKEIRA